MFGAESLAAIQREVVVEAIRTRPKSAIGGGLQKTIEKAYPFLQASKGVMNAIGGKFGFTTEAFSVPPEVLQRVALRPGWSVCFDDVERLPSSIDLDLLFGYISILRDEYKINVAMIYNEEKIPDKRAEDLRRYAEKTVDREIVFAPTTREIVDLVFGGSLAEDVLDHLGQKCGLLRLRNIRILGRVKRYYEEAASVIRMSPEPEYLQNLLWSLLLFSWVKFERADAGDLTLEFLDNYDGSWDISDRDHEGEKDRRQTLLGEYPYRFSDDLDRELIRFVDTSLLDSEKVLAHYENFLLEKKRERARLRLDRAWEHFHSSFQDTETKFGDEIYAAARDDMDYLPLVHIDSVMAELDDMGRKGDANALLQQVKRGAAERLAQFDDFSGKLRYAALKELVDEARRTAARDERPIGEVIGSALSEDLIPQADRKRLAQFSENDFLGYFSSTDAYGLTTNLRKLVKATSIRGGDEYDAVVNRVLRKVAQRLAKTSPLNRRRIEAMGLLEPESADEASPGPSGPSG